MIKREEILVVGAGGHAKSVLDVLLSTQVYTVVGIIGVKAEVGNYLLGIPVIGTDEDLPRLLSQTPRVVIAAGQIKTPEIRVKLYRGLKQLGALFPIITSPKAHVSDFASLDEGTVVHHNAYIGPNTTVGKMVIVNSSASIDHDCVIEDFCHISTGALLNGTVEIGTRTMVGSGAVIKNNVTVADNNIIGMGAVLIQSTAPGNVYVGNPARNLN